MRIEDAQPESEPRSAVLSQEIVEAEEDVVHWNVARRFRGFFCSQ